MIRSAADGVCAAHPKSRKAEFLENLSLKTQADFFASRVWAGV
jgi:hypothetical protein